LLSIYYKSIIHDYFRIKARAQSAEKCRNLSRSAFLLLLPPSHQVARRGANRIERTSFSRGLHALRTRVHACVRARARGRESEEVGTDTGEISVGQSRVNVRIQRSPHDNARDVCARLDWPNAPLRLFPPRLESDEAPRNEIKGNKGSTKAVQFIYRFVNLCL